MCQILRIPLNRVSEKCVKGVIVAAVGTPGEKYVGNVNHFDKKILHLPEYQSGPSIGGGVR